jgi:RNA polymerase sigma-70 factor, ECF subfamily
MRIVKRPAERGWTDVELIEKLLSGDQHAWTELLRRYRRIIYACVTRALGRHRPDCSTADVDDVYGEVMMALVRDDMRKLRSFDPRRGMKLGSFLGLISWREALDAFRRSRRHLHVDRDDLVSTLPDERASALDRILDRERRERADAILGELSPRDRSFVSLYYEQELDADDVAVRMKISLKTVYSKKHKLLSRLSSVLAAATPF